MRSCESCFIEHPDSPKGVTLVQSPLSLQLIQLSMFWTVFTHSQNWLQACFHSQAWFFNKILFSVGQYVTVYWNCFLEVNVELLQRFGPDHCRTSWVCSRKERLTTNFVINTHRHLGCKLVYIVLPGPAVSTVLITPAIMTDSYSIYQIQTLIHFSSLIDTSVWSLSSRLSASIAVSTVFIHYTFNT